MPCCPLENVNQVLRSYPVCRVANGAVQCRAMYKRRELAEAIASDVVFAPLALDALTARIAEQVGF